MEAVEGRQHRLQGRPFEVQRFGNGQLLLLGMRVRCGPAQALGLQPPVELLDAGKAQARLEEPAPDRLDLMFDLTLLPSRLQCIIGTQIYGSGEADIPTMTSDWVIADI